MSAEDKDEIEAVVSSNPELIRESWRLFFQQYEIEVAEGRITMTDVRVLIDGLLAGFAKHMPVEEPESTQRSRMN